MPFDEKLNITINDLSDAEINAYWASLVDDDDLIPTSLDEVDLETDGHWFDSLSFD